MTRSSLRTVPHPTENRSHRVSLPFSSLLVLSYFFSTDRYWTTPRPKEALSRPLSLRVLCMQATLRARLWSRASQASKEEGRASRELHAASIYPPQTYRAIRRKIATRALLSFSFSLSFSMEWHDECPHCSGISCLERRRTDISECIPRLAKRIAGCSSRGLERARTLQSRVFFQTKKGKKRERIKIKKKNKGKRDYIRKSDARIRATRLKR